MNKEKTVWEDRFEKLEKKFTAFGEKRKNIIYTIIVAAFLFFGDFLIFTSLENSQQAGKQNFWIEDSMIFISIAFFVSAIALIIVLLGNPPLKDLCLSICILLNLMTFVTSIHVPNRYLWCILTWGVTDLIISRWLLINIYKAKTLFTITEIKEVHKFSDKNVEITKKHYPFLFPIIIALITALGTIIAALLK